MPTVSSLPTATSVFSSDVVPISQVNTDGSITLRQATVAQILAGGTGPSGNDITTYAGNTLTDQNGNNLVISS